MKAQHDSQNGSRPLINDDALHESIKQLREVLNLAPGEPLSCAIEKIECASAFDAANELINALRLIKDGKLMQARSVVLNAAELLEIALGCYDYNRIKETGTGPGSETIRSFLSPALNSHGKCLTAF
jgi:hypothetical protein